MSGRQSRDKGQRGERELAAYLRRRGFDAERNPQFRGARDGADVSGLPGCHVEVKRCERLALWPALEQAQEDAPEGTVPLVVHRPNRRPWVVVLALDHFLELVLPRGRE